MPLKGFSVKGELVGVKDALGRLDAVRRGARGQILRKGLNAATAPVLKAAKANTPRLSGLANKSLGRKVIVYRQSGIGVGIVGPRSGFRRTVVLALTPRGKVAGAVAGTRRAQRLQATASRSVTKVFDPVNYFHLIERGRKQVSAKEKRALSSGLAVFGRVAAAVEGRRPLARAWASTQATASEALRSTVEREIAAEAEGRA
jgi:hypothetical protein